jgi:alginate O-acetyltransferase complex protein AlgI
MSFNSVNFAIFLPIVFILYWFAAKENFKLQNIILLVSSYFFYACWDWRFMFLLVFSTLVDYITGIKIYEARNKKIGLRWLWVSIVINLACLGVFKYYDFFASSFAYGLSLLGFKASIRSLHLMLPIGISFYTFHGLSYVLDLYKRKITPERNFVNYSVFVCFFPLLVAGPIERATHLLPQILKKRSFDYARAVDGLQQILWGLFKKIVIADNCAEYANIIFDNSRSYSGSTLALGAFFFTVQIYCDFSGYSDIALGTARLFGIDLLRNFSFPYFSRDIAEFWRRWHISLSSWFKDYLYIPLGGSRGDTWMKIRNTFIIFLVSGFWHGANWTFIVWGLLHALFIMPSIIFNTHRKNLDIVARGRYLPTIREFFSIGITFTLTVFAWIFFRATSVTHAVSYVSGILSGSLFTIPYFPKIGQSIPILFITIIFFIIEWLGRENQYAIASISREWKRPARYSMYYAIMITIFWFGGKDQQFIYFQF